MKKRKIKKKTNNETDIKNNEVENKIEKENISDDTVNSEVKIEELDKNKEEKVKEIEKYIEEKEKELAENIKETKEREAEETTEEIETKELEEDKDISENHKNEEVVEKETVEETGKDEKQEDNEEKVEMEIHDTAKFDVIPESNFKLNEELEDIAKEKNKIKRITITSIVAFVLLMIFSTIFSLLNLSNPRIIKNVYINNIPVENLFVSEAESKLNKIYQDEYDKDITLKLNDFEYKVRPKQIEFKPEIEKTVKDAYNFGRNKNIFKNNYDILGQYFRIKKIPMTSNFNKELYDGVLTDLTSKIPGQVKQPSYNIEDKTLFVYPGEEGLVLDNEKIKKKIIERFEGKAEENVIEIPVSKVAPNKIDIEQIYKEVKKDPIDASYNPETKKVVIEENGIDFDISLDEAKKIFLENKEEYQIPIKIIPPKVRLGDLKLPIFDNTIATYSTNYNPGLVGRTKNLQIAASKINGLILKPGETFSYNKVLGKRTIAAGYQNAAIFSGGKVVDDVGGGICQISSTLYGAVLNANLQVIERTNHGMQTSYSKPGMDATVYYGSLDFKFKNNRNVPIKLFASVSGGRAVISIKGENPEGEKANVTTETLRVIPRKLIVKEDPNMEIGKEVVQQGGADGKEVRTYKQVIRNGQAQARTIVSTDIYNPSDRIVVKGTKKVEPKSEPKPEPKPEPEGKPEEETETEDDV